MHRQLYRELGYSSINQYADQKLGFSRSRAGDFIRLARRLEKLPRVRAAVADGKIGYTKARAIVSVGTPETEESWARGGRGQAGRPGRRGAKGEARRSALVERLHKLGGAPADRAELMLEALASLAEARQAASESDNIDSTADLLSGGPFLGRPPVQIHVHEDAATGRMTVQTDAGELELGRADAELMLCDAAVSQPGRRNTTTIPRRLPSVVARAGAWISHRAHDLTW